MENDPNESHESEPHKPKSSPLIALLLGFTPAAILISLFSGFGRIFSGASENEMLWIACIISIMCCFVSSALLFRRGTGGAIGGAVLLVFLNGFIAFFFGCCASIHFG